MSILFVFMRIMVAPFYFLILCIVAICAGWVSVLMGIANFFKALSGYDELGRRIETPEALKIELLDALECMYMPYVAPFMETYYFVSGKED